MQPENRFPARTTALVALLLSACGTSTQPPGSSTGSASGGAGGTGGATTSSTASSSGSGGTGGATTSSTSSASTSTSSSGLGGTGGATTSSTSSSSTSSSSTSSTSSTTSTTSTGCTGTQVLCGGACVDLDGDPQHCGACGHDCLGGACSGGLCAPTDIVSGQSAILVQVDAMNVYYTTYYDIMVLPLVGGTAKKINSPSGVLALGPSNIALDAGHVFWTSGFSPSTGFVLSVSKSGYGQSELVDQLDPYGQPWSLTTIDLDTSGNARSVYWVARGDGMWLSHSVVKTSLGPSGTSNSVVGSVPTKFPRGVALDASNVYVSGVETGEVYRLPRTGGASTVIATGLASPFDLLGDGQNLYAIANGATYTGGNYTDGTVWKIPLAGGAPVALATGVINPAGLAIDATRVYFTQAGPTPGQGSVTAVPIAGGPGVTIAANQPSPRGIAVDGAYVYWADYGVSGSGGGVRKAPK